MATPNKGYATQATGDNPGTWGEILNDDVFDIIDKNIGGILNLALSAANVTLTTAQSRNAIIRLTGTLLANITITTECLGFFFVENETTGNFTVTVRNNIVATSTIAPQSQRCTVLSDATNGCRLASETPFAAGTKMLFYSNTAPIGWAIETSLNDRALRIVSGSGAGGGTGGATGGTTAFSTVFTGRTIAQANLPNVTLTAQSNGAHTHRLLGPAGGENNNTSFPPIYIMARGSNNNGTYDNNDLVQSSGAHTHSVPLGGSGTALDFDVQFASVIVATKGS